MSRFHLDEQAYVPVDQFHWRTTDAGQEADFEDRRWPSATGLQGQTLEIRFGGGPTINYEFGTDGRLTWSEAGGGSGTEDISVAEVRPNIYAVAFRKAEALEDVLLVVDTARGRALLATTHFDGVFEDMAYLLPHTHVLHGAINGAELVELEPSDVLSSQRVIHAFSEQQMYEHIYLNKSTAVWQCLVGGEQGEADLGRVEAYLFDEELIVLVWHERAAPGDGVLVIDRAVERSTGRLSTSEGIFVMGARSFFLPPLTYPEPTELGLS